MPTPESEVREEYSRLSADFRILVTGAGFDLPEKTWHEIDVIMHGCECLDRVVDSLPTREARIRLAAEISNAIAAGRVTKRGTELDFHLLKMGNVFTNTDSRYRASANVARIYEISDQLRGVKTRRHYIELVCEEGRKFLDLFVPILEPHCPARFLEFFLELGEVGDLVDKFVDARADYVRDEHPFPPDFLHHLRLLIAVIRRTPKILRLYPNPLVLIRWASRYFLPGNHRSAHIPLSAEKRSNRVRSANQPC
ncbi:MAG: hypothetical protein HKN23_13600 [Verrucomicrobiales bacterium]|nr:hypothetical protein [Verrucomicrobiales bacterium]